MLISCDDFKFHVRSSILSLASPIFNDMLSLPQPASVEKDEVSAPAVTSLPSISLSETGEVIDLLLRYSYPVSTPRNGIDFDTLASVLSASEKYEMEFLKEEMEHRIENSYANDPRYCMLYLHRTLESRDPIQFQRYALTCLEYPLVSLVRGRQLNSPEYLLPTLIEYHQAASMNIGEYISNYKYTEPNGSRTHVPTNGSGRKSEVRHYDGRYSSCPFCSWDSKGTKAPQWYEDSLLLMVKNVYKEGPLSKRILPIPSACPNICASCKLHLPETWNLFKDYFYECILTEVKKVNFFTQFTLCSG